MVKRYFLVAITVFSASCLTLNSVQASTVFLTQNSFELAVGGVEIANFDTDGNGNSIPANTEIDQQYVPIGMDFNPFADGETNATAFNNSSPPNILIVNDLEAIGGGGGGFEVVLTNPSSGIGMYFGGLQPPDLFDATILELLDTSGNLIDSFIVQDEVGVSAFGLLFFGVTSNELIKSFNVTVGDRDYVWFDDVQYGVNPIPVPAAFWLFGTALVGLISLNRRRKAA